MVTFRLLYSVDETKMAISNFFFFMFWTKGMIYFIFLFLFNKTKVAKIIRAASNIFGKWHDTNTYSNETLQILDYCSVHSVQHMIFWGIFRQEIVVVNEIVLQYTKTFFLTENIHQEAKNYVPLPFTDF